MQRAALGYEHALRHARSAGGEVDDAVGLGIQAREERTGLDLS